jgi:queuine tRNA-ribosyltransferase
MATPCLSFKVDSQLGDARKGTLSLTHGEVSTPAFMPVGTKGAVSGIAPSELFEAGARMVLANTYHLWLRPGHEQIAKFGGIGKFMGWDGPVLTDSGGYQVFSLRSLTKVTEDGVTFRSPINGEKRHLTPEIAIEIQEAMGVDVAMAFDECIEWPATRERVIASTERTTRWLQRCLGARQHAEKTAMFGIVQGGMYEDLRREHARILVDMDLDGLAIGGLSVGEGHQDMMEMTSVVVDELGTEKVRYLMGVGHPVDIVEAIARGIDLFDCVLPSRAGRHAQAYTSVGKMNFRNARYREDQNALDPNCSCATCRGYSRGYLRYLTMIKEPLGARLLSLHNISYYQSIMARARAAIASNSAVEFALLREEAKVASAPAPLGC